MKHKPVMKHNPLIEIIPFLFVLFSFAFVLISSGKALGIFLCVPIVLIIMGLGRVPDWLKWYRLKAAIKQTTEARIVDRRVKGDDFKGTMTYTHIVTYRFYTLEDKEVFDFEEQVSETLYNSLSIGTLLAVEYAITNPRLARSSLPRVKELSSSRESARGVLLDKEESPSYRVEETPVYPDTPEQEQ